MSEAMIRGLLVMVVGALSLQGCADSIPDRLGAPIEGYSHTSAAINRFSVNKNGGPNIGPYGGGGKQNCCATLPVKWHPGLTVVVEWEKDPDPHAYGVGLSRCFLMGGENVWMSTKPTTPAIVPLWRLRRMSG